MNYFPDKNETQKQKTRGCIVPVYGILDGDIQVIGTAIILKCGLIITAAHTFYNEIKEVEGTVKATRKNELFEIEVEEKKYPLGKPVYERYSWDYNIIKDEIYHDLSIFKIPDKLVVQSSLCLRIIYEGEFRIKGYPFSTGELYTSAPCKIDNQINSVRIYDEIKRIPKTFINCFHVNQSVTYGISGGPVLRENEVVGMVVYGAKDLESNFGSSAIKSKHILEVIKENGLNE